MDLNLTTLYVTIQLIEIRLSHSNYQKQRYSTKWKRGWLEVSVPPRLSDPLWSPLSSWLSSRVNRLCLESKLEKN